MGQVNEEETVGEQINDAREAVEAPSGDEVTETPVEAPTE